ncbi:MAG: hypothetical protein ACJZ89_01305 [Paracoccaceae bacterium]
MTPNFALKLSEDTIVLLQRSTDGESWHIEGEVLTESETLESDIKVLQEKVTSLAGLVADNDFIKIILPEEQLFSFDIVVPNTSEIEIQYALENEISLVDYYKSIDQKHKSTDERFVRNVDSLAYDISGSPPNISVIATPISLLKEIEEFFSQFNFKIAGYTAIPSKKFPRKEPYLSKNLIPPIIPFAVDNVPVKITTREKKALDLEQPKVAKLILDPKIKDAGLDSSDQLLPKTPSAEQPTEPDSNKNLNIGSFRPFAELEQRKVADFHKRIKRSLVIVILVLLGPIVFFSIYSLSEFLQNTDYTKIDASKQTNAQDNTTKGAKKTEEQGKEPSVEDQTLQNNNLELAKKIYKENGIWQFVPKFKNIQMPVNEYSLFDPARDIMPSFEDAPSVSGRRERYQEIPFNSPLSPVYKEDGFKLGSNGLVAASKTGTLNPDGIMIYLGEPPVPARKRPKDLSTGLRNKINNELETFKPKLRPRNMLEMLERARFGGLSRYELSKRSPLQRTRETEDLIKKLIESNKNLVAVARTSRASADGDSPQKVLRSAVNRNAINLRKISLIGTSGRAPRRNAIIRFPNGTIEKIKLGERLDGGRVVSITQDKLQYQKDGSVITLNLPNG